MSYLFKYMLGLDIASDNEKAIWEMTAKTIALLRKQRLGNGPSTTCGKHERLIGLSTSRDSVSFSFRVTMRTVSMTS